MKVAIRYFQELDISYKVKWINDIENNQYLHYDLPLNETKTLLWFKGLKERQDRADYTITLEGEPVGLIGLLSIDNKNRKAEYYVCLGEKKLKKKGIAAYASHLLIKEAYEKHRLRKIYLYTEIDNINAQRLFEKMNFIKEGLLKNDLVYLGRKIDRYVYGLDVEEYINKHEMEKL